jgi:hypothetical protein
MLRAYASVLVVLWSAALPAALPAADCNGNGLLDADEIAAGESPDCNTNAIPDECETAPLTFTAPSRLSAGDPVRALAVGDIDGNGLLDIVTCERRSITFLYNLGSRSLDDADRALGTNLRDLALGDIDRDGDIDVAVLDSGEVWILANTGGGSFAPPAAIALAGGSSLQAADLSGDGSADLLVTLGGTDELAVVASGAGGFAAPALHAAGGSPLAAATDDLDGDGDLDIAIASTAAIKLLWNDGRGAFPDESTIENVEAPLTGLVLADLDLDGLLDIATASASLVEIIPNRGGGSFGAPSSFRLGTPVNGPSLTAGRLDDDPDVDLAVASFALDTVAAILNRGDGVFRASLELQVEQPASAVALEDLDRDGRADLVAAHANQATVEIFWGGSPLGTSALEFARHVVQLDNFEPHSSAAADFDGDGDLDVATIDGENRLAVLLNSGSGTFPNQNFQTIQDAREMISIAAADINNDGRADIAGVDEDSRRLAVLFNQGNATFRQVETYALGSRPFFVTAGDLDRDGFLDLVSVNEGEGNIEVFRNLRNDRFQRLGATAVGASPLSAAVGDYDQDGDLDVAVAGGGTSQVIVLWNDGLGGFPTRTGIEVDPPSSVVAADMGQNDVLDLVLVSRSRDRVILLRNDGGGGFSVTDRIDLGQDANTILWSEINGDGFPDIVTANEGSNSVSMLLNTGGGLGAPIHYGVGRDPRFAVSGDFNGDGTLDVIASNHSTLNLSVFLNQTPPPGFGEPHLERICTEEDYHNVSRKSELEGVDRTALYVVPAAPGDPALIPTVFQNTRRFPSHRDFLTRTFPDQFPAGDYEALVLRRATRRYFAGRIYRLIGGEDGPLYGFSITGDRPLEEEAGRVHDALAADFALRPFAYYPDTEATRSDARGWVRPDFPVHLAEPEVPFRRGDASADDEINLTDAISLLNYLFLSGPQPTCLRSGDSDDDGRLNLTDGINILSYLFLNGLAPPEPFTSCGLDGTEDELGCEAFAPCES